MSTLQQQNSATFPSSTGEFEGFRRVQRLAYDCVTEIERRLFAGVTEKQVAAMMDAYLREHGVTEYFHKPFVWFGDRTAFVNFRTNLHFFPTSTRLAWGMPVILDVAPAVDGYVADIGYSCCLGENALLTRMQRDLLEYRSLILNGVRAERTLKTIYADVDELITQQGYVNRHRRYPNSVLGHRVTRLPRTWFGRFSVGGFGINALRFFQGELRAFARGAQAHGPFWNGSRSSDRQVSAGVWAIEPHIACEGVGAKWEELLVVTESDAFWLDNDLPHVRRFALMTSSKVALA